MTLLCCPRGRGNWRIQAVDLPGWPDLLFLRARMLLTIGSRVLRIVEVRP
ncbi:hypothetical protein [Variovorax sp.]